MSLSCLMTSIFATAAASETGCEVYVNPDSKTCSSKAAAISGFIATAPNGAYADVKPLAMVMMSGTTSQ